VVDGIKWAEFCCLEVRLLKGWLLATTGPIANFGNAGGASPPCTALSHSRRSAVLSTPGSKNRTNIIVHEIRSGSRGPGARGEKPKRYTCDAYLTSSAFKPFKDKGSGNTPSLRQHTSNTSTCRRSETPEAPLSQQIRAMSDLRIELGRPFRPVGCLRGTLLPVTWIL
jgi:hypothetical protein